MTFFLNGWIVNYWWSCIGKGVRLQPAHQACFLYCHQTTTQLLLPKTSYTIYVITYNMFIGGNCLSLYNIEYKTIQLSPFIYY